MSDNQFSQEKVIEIVKSLETLKEVEEVGYVLHIAKSVNSKNLYISACVEVNMLNDNSSKYIESIQRCHNQIEELGFENAKLTSGNDSDGVSRAYVFSEMCLQ
jgi:uncharacterized protein YlbG (UPF0298 family)